MDQVRETMNIGNIARGSVPQVFEAALHEVLKNISDINTPATQKRSIILKFSFEPSETREVGEITFHAETKLASIKAAKGNFFIAKRGSDVRGYARDPKQDELFAQPQPNEPRAQ
jgi:GH35 family endo-1,4-beta-xylanase